jgi:hypothetical protein
VATQVSETDHSKQRGGAGILNTVARKIGGALGTVASKVGLESDPSHITQPRIIGGKYQKSGKRRLPRKLKKLMGKQAGPGGVKDRPQA